jgi:formate hydrogenlyase subunit 3/multisubunit Na+/H+ antiporter MnhD subunit
MLPASALIVLLPLLAAGATVLLRRAPGVKVIIACGACALVVALLAQPIDATFLGIDIDGQLNLLGRIMRVHQQDRLSLLILFACAAVLLIASWQTPHHWNFAPIGLALLSTVSAALMVRPVQYAGLLLVIAGALGAIMIQARQDENASTLGARRYLISSVLALPAFLGAGYLAQRAAVSTDAAVSFDPAVVMLLLGAGLIMGALPLFTWIFTTAQDAPPLTTAFLSVVSVGASSFLLLTFMREFSWFHDSEVTLLVLRTGGVILLLTATILGWTQQSLGRLMGTALLLDIGCVLLAAAGRTQQGAEAVAFGVAARALAAGLFGIGVAQLRARVGSDDITALRGAGAREIWPTLAIGIGGLSLCGFPGTIGFVATWTNVRAPGVDVETIVVIVLAGVSVAIGVLRALGALLESADQALPVERAQTRAERWMIGAFAVCVLGLGMYPTLIAPIAQSAAAAFH